MDAGPAMAESAAMEHAVVFPVAVEMAEDEFRAMRAFVEAKPDASSAHRGIEMWRR
jgi:hypothetical protein